ncbi:MAG: PepSY domain-containing protein [Bacteroidales bacterium]|nr:PepSY domain-containing protein [Bacteroidales bacterium]
MDIGERIRKAARNLFYIRKIHRFFTLYLVLFFLVMSVSGILLGWKKNSAGLIQAPTVKGISNDASNWLSIDSLQKLAIIAYGDSISSSFLPKINRLDIRPDKGMAKVIFEDAYWGLQIDCTTGEILQIERRYSDFIEQLHDGSIVDDMFGFESGAFKLFYTAFTGLALLLFSATGFWLWYSPFRIRKMNKKTI